LPSTQILLLGLLPRGQSPDAPLRQPIAEVNSLIADLGNEDHVTFVDFGGWFLQPDGTISPYMMADYTHPTLLGYEYYTAAIWGTIVQMLFAPQ
jgi:hypothetical protein